MEDLVFGIILFTMCFLGRLGVYLFKNRKPKKGKKKKIKSGITTEMQYLVSKFNLSEKKVNTKLMASIISVLDAIIITSTLLIITKITKIVTLQLLIGLVIVIVLIFILYEVLGRILKKKGFDK